MADAITTVAAVLTSLKTATDIAKFLRESDLSIERAELKLKLADLIGALADTKIELAGLQEAISDKDNVLRSLRRHSSFGMLSYDFVMRCTSKTKRARPPG